MTLTPQEQARIHIDLIDSGYFTPAEHAQSEGTWIYRYDPKEADEPCGLKWLTAAVCLSAAVAIGVGAVVWWAL